MLVVPVLLGVFLGAPVLAREFETGTFRFAWTQGCGRFRWAVSKLVLLAVLVTAVTWAFTELFSWYYHPFLVDGQVSRLLPLAFGLLGVAFAAWTLAAFAIAAFYGALIRRTLPAMAATLATWTTLAIGTAVWLRQHYQVPLKTTGNPPGGAWILGSYATGPNGQVLSQRALNQLFQQAPASVQNSPNPNALSELAGPAALHAVGVVRAGQPVLALPAHRGRLAARAVRRAHRGRRLAGPPPRRLIIFGRTKWVPRPPISDTHRVNGGLIGGRGYGRFHGARTTQGSSPGRR